VSHWTIGIRALDCAVRSVTGPAIGAIEGGSIGAVEAVSARSAVAVLLVDRAGRVLLQLRDEHAPVGPGRWSTVGGAVEPGERPSDAAARELAEETSLVAGQLELWFAGTLRANAGPGTTAWHVYAAASSATDADIVVGEGADIRFVSPAVVAGLDLLPAAHTLVTRFLESSTYVRLGRR